jgi:hypothetical protein
MTAKSEALNRAALVLRENIFSEMEECFSGPDDYNRYAQQAFGANRIFHEMGAEFAMRIMNDLCNELRLLAACGIDYRAAMEKLRKEEFSV